MPSAEPLNKGTLVPGTVISKVICGIFVKSMKLVNYRKLIIRISPITQLKRHIIFIWDFTNWTLVCLFVKNLSVSYIQFVISQIAQMCAEKSLSINDNKTLNYFVLHPENKALTIHAVDGSPSRFNHGLSGWFRI